MTLKDMHFRAIDLLLEGRRQKAVAGMLNVSEESLCRWLTDPDFADALYKARTELRRAHVETLTSLADDALETLRGLLQSADEKVRVQAVSLVLKSVGLDALPSEQRRVESPAERRLAEAGDNLVEQLAASYEAMAGLRTEGIGNNV